MLLERLELYGFKSFAQRTQLRFSRGITAIVGPNGCGKSNISDAIRWALGEQNVRQLRGQQLADVIFKGTREAKPLGLAEVSLHLDNRDQRLASEYGEVTIQRRTFRSGESDFRINKAPCRLRDIRDLFMDTGLGSAEYAVIQREMIDEVLADRDQARRSLIDEASGITRYKQRRKEALQKLQAVEADLVRVDDALEIEEREVRSLAYQMGKARRYRRLSERIRGLDIALCRLRWRELAASVSGDSGRLGAEERQREQWLTQIRQAEAEQESLRVDLLEAGRRGQTAQQRLTESETELSALREEAVGLRERVRALRERSEDLELRIASQRQLSVQAAEAAAGLEPEAERLAAEQDGRRAVTAAAERAWTDADQALRAAREELARRQQLQIDQVRRRTATDHRLEALRERGARLAEGKQRLREQQEGLRSRAGELAGELTRLEERRREAEALLSGAEERERAAEARRESLEAAATEAARRLGALAEEEARSESRLLLLEEQSRSFAGFRESVARLLAHRQELPGVLGVASELIAVAPEWRERLAPALRELTDWIVTDGEDAAWRAIAWLRERGLGQVTFFPLAAAAPEGAGAEAPRLPREALAPRAPEARPLVEHLLGRVHPVGGRDEVPRKEERPEGSLWVTPGGEVLAGAGWLCAGGPDSAAHLWERPDETDRLRGAVAGMRAEREALLREEAEHSRAQAELRAAIEALAAECRERRTTLANLDHASAERQAEARLLRAEIERLDEEALRLEREEAACAAEVEGSRAEQAEVSATAETADDLLRRLSARAEELGAEKDARGRTLTERKMEEVWAETQLRDARGALAHRRAEEAEARRLVEGMEAEREGAGRETAAASARLVELAELETKRMRTREAQSREVDRLGEERRRLEGLLSGIEQDLRGRRRELSDLEETLRENEVRLARVEGEKERLLERVREQYRVDLAALERTSESGSGAGSEAPAAVPGAGAASPADGETPPAARPAEPDPAEVLADLTPAGAQERLEQLRIERERLGPVNVLAIEEHEKKRDHVRFIREQRDDLLKSKEQLLAAIDRINTEARRLQAETFSQVQENFSRTFATLFPGGEARIQLAGEDPLEAEIEIVARPRGKRLENIRLLSSGERALTATALLFGLYLVKPSPFCVLDEVDAPLDDANIERFIHLLRSFSERTQFIVITHNKLTMETADVLYGVTMQEPGISRVVSVRLERGQLVTDDQEAGRALAGLV
ncbi:MAG: chromosome segregation protein SMC [Candidatus Eisenbacteria bacterium]|uniref:Chromosome partition protein Smc n=1 Tax=Eiseniibacteriota bacterium TaxID=2212470 RepID=A0A937XB03_UNCEI|nr:chromosome segregation protein SMC [Candidatus Eisenbacteria bacterium]